MTKTLGSREARQNWRTLIDNAFLGISTFIERGGKEVAVVVPAAQWRELQHLRRERALRLSNERHVEMVNNPAADTE